MLFLPPMSSPWEVDPIHRYRDITFPGATKTQLPAREAGKKGEKKVNQSPQRCFVRGPLFPLHRLAQKGSERSVTS